MRCLYFFHFFKEQSVFQLLQLVQRKTLSNKYIVYKVVFKVIQPMYLLLNI
jgi:hypothetical protein